MSCPSRAASVAVITSSAPVSSSPITASCFDAVGSVSYPFAVLIRRTVSVNGSGMTGSFSLLMFSPPYSAGEPNARRWPKVHVTAYPPPVKYPSFLLFAPMHSAMHLATEGFSVTISFIILIFYGFII